MKKAVVLTGIIAITLALGCKKLIQLANINVDVPYSQQVAIPQIVDTLVILPAGGMSVAFPVFAIPTNSRQYIDSFHTTPDKILRVNVKTLSMKIAGAANNSFDFLDSVQVYISGGDLGQQLVAYSYNIPKGLDSLSLDTVSNTNLKPYFLLDTMYIQLNAHFNAVPPGSAQLTVYSIFHLLANPLY